MLASEKLQQSIIYKTTESLLGWPNTCDYSITRTSPLLSPPPQRHADSNDVNLSYSALSARQVSVLSRGLNFVLTPIAINHFSIFKDLQQFSRCLHLSVFFHSKSDDTGSKFSTQFKVFMDPLTQAGRVFSSMLMHKPLKIKFSLFWHSLLDVQPTPTGPTETFYTAFRLAKIIIPAGKSGGIVAMKAMDYVAESCRQLHVDNTGFLYTTGLWPHVRIFKYYQFYSRQTMQ